MWNDFLNTRRKTKLFPLHPRPQLVYHDFTFDPVGRQLVVSNPLKGTNRYSYDLAGQRIETRDEVGNLTKFAYSQRGWVTQVTDPRGRNWVTTYDAAGNALTQTDPLNHTITSEYDELHRARKVTDQVNNYTHTVWWGDGRTKETRDGRGYKTAYSYDLTNRKITRTDAVGTPKERNIETTIDEVENVVSIKDGLNQVRSFTRNVNDAVTEVYVSGRLVTKNVLDKMDLPIEIYDGLNMKTTVERDALGRVKKTTTPLGGTQQSIVNSRDFRVGVIDALGNVQQFVFDSAGQQVFTIDPAGGLERLRSDGARRPFALSDPVGNQTRFRLDERGLLVEEKDFAGKTLIQVYDDAGRLTSTPTGWAACATSATSTTTWCSKRCGRTPPAARWCGRGRGRTTKTTRS